jgi:hypothetical protein
MVLTRFHSPLAQVNFEGSLDSFFGVPYKLEGYSERQHDYDTIGTQIVMIQGANVFGSQLQFEEF